jgi:hypothetical protein
MDDREQQLDEFGLCFARAAVDALLAEAQNDNGPEVQSEPLVVRSIEGGNQGAVLPYRNSNVDGK